MKKIAHNAFTLIELLVVITIIAILAGIALPVFGQVQAKGQQTKALSNAKQVGLACKLFATDYEGAFPKYTDMTTKALGPGSDSNGVLQTLIPEYLPEKAIFSLPKSAWCQGAATGTPVDKLAAGENEWSYVFGLSDSSNSSFPLIASGFDSTAVGKYTTVETAKGGVWKGKKAIVIRADISGAVENVDSSLKSVARKDVPTKDIFTQDTTAGAEWLGGSVTVLPPK